MDIQELKNKYGEVYEIKLGNKVGYFKCADFNTYAAVSDLYTTGDILEADATLAKMCFIGGDSKLIDLDNHCDLFLAYKARLAPLFKTHNSKVVSYVDGVIEIEVDGKTCKIKTPAFKEMKVILSLYEAGKYFEADKLILKYGWIEGNDDIRNFKDFPSYFVSIRRHLSNLFSKESSEIIKK